jgi:hypothetical protein
MIGLDGLRHHCRNDPKAAEIGFVVSVLIKEQVDAKGANGPVVDKERHAHKGDVPLIQILPAADAVQEHGLTADLRHNDRLSGFDDASGDALSQAVVRAATGIAETDGSFDSDFSRIPVQHGDRPTHHFVVEFEDFEHPLECRSRGQGRAESTPDFKQSAEVFAC